MDPFELTPEEQQRVMAETLRSQAVLGEAQRRGSRFDNLAAIAPLVNNKAINETAKAAQSRAVSASKPVQLGNTGFMVGDQFAANPGFLQENLEKRAQVRGLAAERARTAAELQQQRLAQAAQLQQERLAAQAFQAEQNRALRGTLAAIAAGNKTSATDAKGKTLPFGAIEKMTKKEGVRDAYVDLANGFKDEFSGTPGIAGLENMAGKFVPGLVGQTKADQANWWQNYQEQTNLVRNALFGSALTATEKAAFDAQNIVPGMAPTEIKRRLAQQAYIADQAYSKLVKATGGSGYDVSGFSTDRVAAPAPKPGQASTGKVKDAPATERVPAGVDPALWKQMTPEERALWN